jgi:tetratricopeptide (TPR) repeat protein
LALLRTHTLQRGSLAMTNTTVLWNFALLVSLLATTPEAWAAGGARTTEAFLSTTTLNAYPQGAAAKKEPQWKSREEYDAFTAMANEKDPSKRIQLAEAFLAKFPNSDFKDNAYVVEMQTYAQLNQSEKAVEAAHKALEANPDNLAALRYLSFAFPFLFKTDDPDAASKLSRAESGAKHGLELLQTLQKPANATEEQFQQGVKEFRSVFNSGIGFVALQRKDYPAAITAFKAAIEDNPSDFYTFYRMGLAYLYSSPPDYDHAVWYLSRAVALAKTANSPAGAEIDKFLRRAYVNYHGTDQGLQDIINQAASSPNPPSGFKVSPMETPKKTGNQNIDAFNEMTFPLKLGGDRAQKTWDALKGQPLELAGFVDSVEKGPDAGTYIVRIDILDQSKAASGVYDVELKDTSQPNVKNLSPVDPVRFKGTISAYTATPNLVITVDGTIDPDTIPAEPKAKPKPKTPPRHRPTRQTQSQ